MSRNSLGEQRAPGTTTTITAGSGATVAVEVWMDGVLQLSDTVAAATSKVFGPYLRAVVLKVTDSGGTVTIGEPTFALREARAAAGVYTYATLPDAAAVAVGTSAHTSDYGPVWSDGTYWKFSRPPLFILRSADLNVTTDQAFTKIGTFTNYHADKIVAKWVSGDSLIAVGGIYPAASKAGTALVANTQEWDLLASAGKIKVATLAAVNGTDAQTATPILALTTAAGGAAVADLYIYGTPLD